MLDCLVSKPHISVVFSNFANSKRCLMQIVEKIYDYKTITKFGFHMISCIIEPCICVIYFSLLLWQMTQTLVLIIHDIMFNSYCLLCLTSFHTRNERFFYFTLNTLTKLFTWSLDNFIYLGQKNNIFYISPKLKKKIL